MRKDAAVRRQEVLELAARGLGPKAIAEQLGINDRTVRGHLNDPSTTAELRRLQEDRLRRLSVQALDLSESALGVLRQVAEDAEQLGSARVAAARAILDSALRMLEIADLAERVAALEEQHAADQSPKRARAWGT